MRLAYLPDLPKERRSTTIGLEGETYKVGAGDGQVDIPDDVGRRHANEFATHGFRIVDTRPYEVKGDDALAAEAPSEEKPKGRDKK